VILFSRPVKILQNFKEVKKFQNRIIKSGKVIPLVGILIGHEDVRLEGYMLGVRVREPAGNEPCRGFGRGFDTLNHGLNDWKGCAIKRTTSITH